MEVLFILSHGTERERVCVCVCVCANELVNE